MLESKRPHRIRPPVVLGVLVALLLWATPPSARAAGARTLRAVDGRRTPSGWLVELGFEVPLRYMAHSPRGPAESVRIELRSLGLGRAGDEPLGSGQTLRPFEGRGGPPIVAIETLASASVDELIVEIRFATETAYEIRQGSDLSRLEIVLPEADAENLPRYEAAAASLLATANEAMATGDLGRAIQIYTRVLSMNAPSAHPEALERLGMARERSGQRAHAKAEYERFLEQFPDDPRAPRVRQRLQALTTADATISEPTTLGATSAGGTRVDLNGSLLSYYSRAQGFFGDDLGSQLYDSSWINDLFLRARVRTDRVEVESSAAGRMRLDFADDEIGPDSRLNALLVEVSERGGGWWGNVGRQRGDGGVIGRFDGARLGYRFTDWLEVQVLGGFPLESYSSDHVNTDRYQVGGAVRLLDVASLVDVEIYGNYQREADLTVRGAVGAEIRHLRRGRTIVATVDYDAFFNVVNIATLLVNQQITDALSVNGLAEYRKSPIVTMENALIGQSADSLAQLSQTYSPSEMKQLAEDRSANATTFSAGARYDLSDGVDVTGSFTATSYGSTVSSGGVQGFEGTGYEFGYLVQVGVRSFLMDRDVNTLGLRIYDGRFADRYMLEAIGRYPVWRTLRLNPILRVEYRNERDDSIRVVPRLRLDYGWRRVSFDVDLAYEWATGVGESDRPTENTYSIVFGVRWDF